MDVVVRKFKRRENKEERKTEEEIKVVYLITALQFIYLPVIVYQKRMYTEPVKWHVNMINGANLYVV